MENRRLHLSCLSISCLSITLSAIFPLETQVFASSIASFSQGLFARTRFATPTYAMQLTNLLQDLSTPTWALECSNSGSPGRAAGSREGFGPSPYSATSPLLSSYYGFAKKDSANIDSEQLRQFRRLAKFLLTLDEAALDHAT